MLDTVPAPAGFLLDQSDEQIVQEAVDARELAEAAEAEAGSPHRWRAADRYHDLSQRGWTGRQIARSVGVSEGTVSKYLKCVRVFGTENRPTFWNAYADVTGERAAHVRDVMGSSESVEWPTPQDLFDLLDAEFGFEVDVCATPGFAKCERFFSPEEDGLAQEWHGTCWMNPPYGDEIGAWMNKAYEESLTGAVVVCLVPARVDTAWWWDYALKGEIRFLRGRLKTGKQSWPFPSALVILGRAPKVVWWERPA